MRDVAVRSELLHEHVRVDTQLLDRAALELLDPVELACPRHLVAVRCVGEVAQLVLDTGELLAQHDGLTVALGAVGLTGLPQHPGSVERDGQPVDGVCRGGADCLGHARLPAPALAPLAQPLAGGDLVAGGALEGVGSPGERASALLPGAQREAQLGLRGAPAARLQIEAVTLVGRGVVGLLGFRLRLGEPGLQALEVRAVVLQGGPGVGDGAFGAIRLGRG